MTGALLVATIAMCAVAIVMVGWCVIRDRSPGWYVIGALGLLELVVLVVSVAGLIQVATTDRDIEKATLVVYLLVVLVVVPAGTLWALVEKTRFGTSTIVVACLAVLVMVWRAHQIWTANG